MTCSNYRSGSGEMWPWCLHCGRHLHDHTISDDPSWTSDALAGVLPAGAIPGDGPPARTGIPTGETQRPPAALPVTSPAVPEQNSTPQPLNPARGA